jgi:cyclic pyranopterin phosphate synthase
VPLVDRFQRAITYLRLSVIDRCDLRCTYCMPERQTFLPKSEVLSLEELHRLSLGFMARGVRKIRLTGGASGAAGHGRSGSRPGAPYR